MIKHVIFDLDQTLVDTRIAEIDRDNRSWPNAYSKIPQMKVYDGIKDVLWFLDQNKITYSVLTSSPGIYCKKVLEFYNLVPTQVIAYHDVSRRKPHPEGIQKILNLMKIDCFEAIHIGDRDIDTIAAKNAGVCSIGALWGNKDNSALIKSQPDFLAESPEELKTIISNLKLD